MSALPSPTPSLSPPRRPFPRHLPGPPADLRPPHLEALELNNDLADIPLTFVAGMIREMGAVLVESASQTVARPEPYTRLVEGTAHCTRPPNAALPPPTHLLDISFTDSRLLVRFPIHGLPFALLSPLLSHASRRTPHPDEQGYLVLPLVSLSLPSHSTFDSLHSYIYTTSSSSLLSFLLNPPPLLAHLVVPPGGTNIAAIAFRLERIRALRSNAVALEVGDERLWEAMERAWEVLMTEAREGEEEEEEVADERGSAAGRSGVERGELG